jgi:hypothetical protein
MKLIVQLCVFIATLTGAGQTMVIKPNLQTVPLAFQRLGVVIPMTSDAHLHFTLDFEILYTHIENLELELKARSGTHIKPEDELTHMLLKLSLDGVRRDIEQIEKTIISHPHEKRIRRQLLFGMFLFFIIINTRGSASQISYHAIFLPTTEIVRHCHRSQAAPM